MSSLNTGTAGGSAERSSRLKMDYLVVRGRMGLVVDIEQVA